MRVSHYFYSRPPFPIPRLLGVAVGEKEGENRAIPLPPATAEFPASCDPGGPLLQAIPPSASHALSPGLTQATAALGLSFSNFCKMAVFFSPVLWRYIDIYHHISLRYTTSRFDLRIYCEMMTTISAHIVTNCFYLFIYLFTYFR